MTDSNAKEKKRRGIGRVKRTKEKSTEDSTDALSNKQAERMKETERDGRGGSNIVVPCSNDTQPEAVQTETDTQPRDKQTKKRNARLTKEREKLPSFLPCSLPTSLFLSLPVSSSFDPLLSLLIPLS